MFELKDLGDLNYFLGVQISRTQFGLTLTQSKHAFDVLHRFHMENSKPTKTPCCPSSRLFPHDGVAFSDPTEFRSMVGAFQYLTFTRPNLAFSVHQLYRFMSKPTTVHLEAAKRFLRYIRGTLSHGISFTPSPLTLTTFSDVDWAGDPFDHRSTTCLLVFLGPSPIFWSSKKHTTIACSSIEAKYCALATTNVEVSWLRILFKELHIFLSHVPILWCDNASRIALSTNLVFHSRMKHIEVDYHYVREKVLCHDLCVRFVSGKDNLADLFTMPLPSPSFLLQHHKLLLDTSPSCLRGDVSDSSVIKTKKLKQIENG